MKIIELLLAIAILILAFYLRMPFWASWRLLCFWTIGIGGIGLIIWSAIEIRKNAGNKRKFREILVLAIASFALSYSLALEIKFNLTKYSVLNAESAILEKLGRHFIVGYRNLDEIETLIEKKAIGGIFITARNVRNKTKQDRQEEIKSWQDIRRQQNLPPLWIAADQEGGVVSRLSPPLTKLPSLSNTPWL